VSVVGGKQVVIVAVVITLEVSGSGFARIHSLFRRRCIRTGTDEEGRESIFVSRWSNHQSALYMYEILGDHVDLVKRRRAGVVLEKHPVDIGTIPKMTHIQIHKFDSL